jgi:hypothetical protein
LGFKDRPSTDMNVVRPLPDEPKFALRTETAKPRPRSALVVPPDSDGLLRSTPCRSIAPCNRTWGSPCFWSLAGPVPEGAGSAWGRSRWRRPSEAFPSLVAVPCHHGLSLLAVKMRFPLAVRLCCHRVVAGFRHASRPQGLELPRSPLRASWRCRQMVARCFLGLLVLYGLSTPSMRLAPKNRSLSLLSSTCPRAGRAWRRGVAAVFGPPEGEPCLAATSAAVFSPPEGEPRLAAGPTAVFGPPEGEPCLAAGSSRVGSARGRAVKATVRVPTAACLRGGWAGVRAVCRAVLRRGPPCSGLGARFARPPRRLGSAGGRGRERGAGFVRPPKRLGSACVQASSGLRRGWGRLACGLCSASEEAGRGSRRASLHFRRGGGRLGRAGWSSTSEEVGGGSQLRCSWLRLRRSGSGAGGRRRSRWSAGSGRGSEELRLLPVFRWAGSSRGRGWVRSRRADANRLEKSR